jgi:hypothetical protein
MTASGNFAATEDVNSAWTTFFHGLDVKSLAAACDARSIQVTLAGKHKVKADYLKPLLEWTSTMGGLLFAWHVARVHMPTAEQWWSQYDFVKDLLGFKHAIDLVQWTLFAKKWETL